MRNHEEIRENKRYNEILNFKLNFGKISVDIENAMWYYIQAD